uniref:Uncharacterized protein n=1 Tax=Anguilla anguilla TaxID=7936 RepID=A0A0E9X2T0_ANGAN
MNENRKVTIYTEIYVGCFLVLYRKKKFTIQLSYNSEKSNSHFRTDVLPAGLECNIHISPDSVLFSSKDQSCALFRLLRILLFALLKIMLFNIYICQLYCTAD